MSFVRVSALLRIKKPNICSVIAYVFRQESEKTITMAGAKEIFIFFSSMFCVWQHFSFVLWQLCFF